ncbi:uncharacterized protein LOC106458595 [Limulus polyphemus]|uniref:Uncharacterized protein LOC106458595 n=1 Tax=Limulus polyphemus TaxID=6850 RepID=A0ABM1SAB7_LIMPO|nr:uncharacterized protein LOC106458595 [Limulus polyphemus]
MKRRCKNDTNQWIEDKRNEAQEAADRGDSKTVYKITIELTSGFKSSGGVPIKAKNGTRLTTERQQLERWKEHFNEVLNQCEPDILLDLSNENVRAILNVNLNDISLEEGRRALQNLKNNKAAGSDELQPELLKNGGQPLELELLNIFNKIWRQETIPSEWGQGVIVTIPKKEELSDCNNWRGIFLLSIPGKAFCYILLERLKDEVDALLREEQAGFRNGRSCTEQIFTLRNIIE